MALAPGRRDLLNSSPTYVDTLSIGHDVNLVLPPGVPNHAGNHGCDPNTWWVDPFSVTGFRFCVSASPRDGPYPETMDVVVEVGGWEHECCGEAVERHQHVEFTCIEFTGPDGRARLCVTNHDMGSPPRRNVGGQVVDIRVVEENGVTTPILRLPDGATLRGEETPEDRLLQDPWTHEFLTTRSHEFLLTVRTS